ncbi:RolB family protein [Bradyrhizobium sp. Cp5.3]|uniref:RolB family protein n=1 Tax=Bradyrhizobium sp. Cp5.3 TaxID=443598 RepID=UPI000485AD46|nr:RolB family protein [Bradyrhizobium sp. Cp5.3]
MTDLPRAFERPHYIGVNFSQRTLPSTLTARLANAINQYRGFLESLLARQQRWVVSVRGAWLFALENGEISYDHLLEFSRFPCMNDPRSGILEQITRNPDGTPAVLYVYTTNDAARACLCAGSLEFIPQNMRFRGADGRQRLVAVDIRPDSGDFSIETIAEKYRSAGCTQIQNEQIERCLVIARTDWFSYDAQKGLFDRAGFDTFDVLAITQVITS